MGVWLGVAMDSLNYHPGLPFYALREGKPLNSLTNTIHCGVHGPPGPQLLRPWVKLFPKWLDERDLN
jgi:hypothetical protein